MRIASGETDADFKKYDETGNRCAEINQAAVDWALKNADKNSVKRYQSKGELAVQTDDRNTINGGLWIPVPLSFTESSDKSKVEISSYAYRMGNDFPVEIFAGDHYCKLLSPFKVMEWIYVDSLYARDSISSTPESETLFLQS